MTRYFTPASVKAAVAASGARSLILEAEVPPYLSPGVPNPGAADWAGIVQAFGDLGDELDAAAVVTNFGAFTEYDAAGNVVPARGIAEPLIDTGWACMTEVSPSEQPGITIERRDFYAKQLGWPVSCPVLYLRDGLTLADFPTREQYPRWSVWSSYPAIR